MSIDSHPVSVTLLFLIILGGFYLLGRSSPSLRIFVPGWQFFAELVDTPVLDIRESHDGQSFTEWRSALRQPQRRFSAVVFNPEGNLYLAKRSLLERLELDISDGAPEEIEYSVSYALVERLAREAVRPDSPFFQFRLRSVPQSELSAEGVQFVLSRVLKR